MIHSYIMLIISVLTIINLFVLESSFIQYLIFITYFIYAFKSGLSWRSFFKIIVFAIFFSASFYFIYVLYGEKQNAIIYKKVEFLFWLGLISMTAGQVVDYAKIVLMLLERKKISVSLGYPFLVAYHSIILLKYEWSKILRQMKRRRLSFYQQIFVLFPLLVYAIRHSERGALALETRGLHEDKVYFHSYQPLSSDWMHLKIYCISYVMLAIIYFLQ